MTRVAAIDCGTNSIRLLVAEIDGDRLRDLTREMRIVRLGQGVDETGRFHPDAIARTLAAVRNYAETARAYGVSAVRMVATSATRDASNRAAFLDGVTEILGSPPDVVSGDEEAALSFVGATRELRGEFPAPFLVVDIGGGSTEFVLGDADVVAARSVDIGCVRMTERHLRADPPSAAQVAAATSDIDAAIAEAAAGVPLDETRTLVGVAGSVTTVAGIALGLPAYDSAVIHRSTLSATQVHEIATRLLAMTHHERAAIPVMHPGRVDVIAAGALVLDRVVRRLGAARVVVSEHDILDGIAWSVAAPRNHA